MHVPMSYCHTRLFHPSRKPAAGSARVDPNPFPFTFATVECVSLDFSQRQTARVVPCQFPPTTATVERF